MPCTTPWDCSTPRRYSAVRSAPPAPGSVATIEAFISPSLISTVTTESLAGV